MTNKISRALLVLAGFIAIVTVLIAVAEAVAFGPRHKSVELEVLALSFFVVLILSALIQAPKHFVPGLKAAWNFIKNGV